MKNAKTFIMVKIALMAALICICAMINIPIGPVPFSMAFLGLALAGALLSPWQSLVSVAVYILLGFIGLPVFTNFQAGPGVLFGPTGGYIYGYFILAFFIAFACKKTTNFALQLCAGLLGMLACYLLGTLWFMHLTQRSFIESLSLCVLPFIIPDIVKIAAALAIGKLIKRRMAVLHL